MPSASVAPVFRKFRLGGTQPKGRRSKLQAGEKPAPPKKEHQQTPEGKDAPVVREQRVAEKKKRREAIHPASDTDKTARRI